MYKNIQSARELSTNFKPKNAFQFNLCRHVGSKSSPAGPLQAVMYPASLRVSIPDDWLL